MRTSGQPLPLVELCWPSLVRGPDQRWTFAPEFEGQLFEQLCAMKADPHLAENVVGLFELANFLFQEHDAPDAAAAILRALHRARPQLPLRDQAVAALYAANDQGLARVIKRAPTANAPAPPGTLKAHRYTNPGRTRG